MLNCLIFKIAEQPSYIIKAFNLCTCGKVKLFIFGKLSFY